MSKPSSGEQGLKTLELAGDVVAGSTAFAGLIIVYVGSVASAFGSYDAEAQGVVRKQFRRRAILASGGIVTAALAASFAILGKWASSNAAVGIAVILLIATLCWGVAVTVETVREIS